MSMSMEAGQKIVAASHAWAAKLGNSYGEVERERMRVGYANGMLAGAVERDRLREQRDELLKALTGGVDEPQLRRFEAVGALVATIENRIDWRTEEDPDAMRQTLDECMDLVRDARAAVWRALP